MNLGQLEAVVFDMDGVLYRGHEPMPGVSALLHALDARGVRYACATNNATLTPEQFSQKLAAMGIAVPADMIVTSPVATRRYLEQQGVTHARGFYVGMEGIRAALFEDGFLTLDADAPEYVVVGLDTEVTYAKLATATLAIRNGARFIGTNPDVSLPNERGLVPGAGALLALLQAASGVAPLVIGKPGPIMFHAAVERLGAPPERTLTVGDRLDTDIAGAKAAGLAAALVLTGVSTRAEIATSAQQPDLVFADLPALTAALASTSSASMR